MRSFSYYIKHPKDFVYAWLIISLKKLSLIIPAKLYLKIQYWLITGYKLNLKNPQTFNEKIQWLKLYDRNPEYMKMVDKYSAKDYVASIVWKEYIIPTFWVWDSFDDINFNDLPNQFVLKCTHDSWSFVICRDKKNFDRNTAKEILQSALNHNYYYYYKEWVYRNIHPRIIAEKYMVDESWIPLKDYKIFCFNWSPKAILVDIDRFSNHKTNVYDLNRKFLPFEFHWCPSNKDCSIKKPEILDKMLNLAKKLSKDIPHVRVDFYVSNEKIYFWELTFYHWAWITKFYPNEWDLKFWNRIKLPKKWT